MEFWSTAKNKVHDASGIENPNDWMWGIPENSITKILYPICRVEEWSRQTKQL